MTRELEMPELLASLRGYLEELRESGVDGLPSGPTGQAPGVTVSSVPAPPAASPPGGTETVEEIRVDLGDCLRCSLGSKRTSLVFGVGNPHARLVFVGEAPGREEDLRGEPFVGEAGQLLTNIIEAMQFQRSDVYICNLLKCRPPGNRDPEPAEIEQCQPFLLRQINAIKPEVIVALGNFAAQTLLASREPISRLRGTFHDYHGIPLMPTFHPAFLLRDAARKKEVWSDMQQVMKLLGVEVPPKDRK